MVYKIALISGILLFGDSLSHSINQQRSKVRVVRTFGTFDTVSEICDLRPDLLVVAIEQLNPSLCLENIKTVRQISPATQVVLLYGGNDAHDVAWIAEEGAQTDDWSFIHVDHVGTVAALCRVFERIAQGETLRIPEVEARPHESRGAGRLVTPSELQALRALVAGASGRGGMQKVGWSLANLLRR